MELKELRSSTIRVLGEIPNLRIVKVATDLDLTCGTFYADHYPSYRKLAVPDFETLRHLPAGVTELDLSSTWFEDAGCSHKLGMLGELIGLPLTSLNLNSCLIDVYSLGALREFPLVKLNLGRCRIECDFQPDWIRDEHLGALRGISLEWLDLTGASITETSFQVLQSMPLSFARVDEYTGIDSLLTATLESSGVRVEVNAPW